MADTSESPPKPVSKTKLVIFGLVFFLLAILIGIIIGYFAQRCPVCGDDATEQTTTSVIEGTSEYQITTSVMEGTAEPDPEKEYQIITEKIISGIKAENIRENLRNMTSYPHLAGTPGDERLADDIMHRWREQGLDRVERTRYEVYLSYPDPQDPNVVTLLDKNGTEVFRSQEKEPQVGPGLRHPDVLPPFNAYSAPGDVKGQLIYVNYGRQEDFELLRDSYNMNFTNRLVIARYGKIYRGDKVKFAERFGAAGIILYNDPSNFASRPEEGVYPKSWWMPPSSTQRGSIITTRGDPLTPGYPAIDSAYREHPDDAVLPRIPCHPIGYGDAYYLLREMSGPEVPGEWQGMLNFTYHIGPELKNNMSVQLHVRTRNRMANSSNIIGYIYGKTEPDRYVLMGNHRDAWALGAVDPTSATAVMMEVTRVLGDLLREGWRPGRTLVFCSWGAAEYALIGSYEWVEQYWKKLVNRAVVYVDLDLAVMGNYSLLAAAVPLLRDAMYHVATKVTFGPEQDKSMYDLWSNRSQAKDENGRPLIHNLGSGSDYAPFIHFAAIPAMDLAYTFDPALKLPLYPLYHSADETFYLYETFIDPDFTISQLMARYIGEMVHYLADSIIVPFNVTSYASAINTYVTSVQKTVGKEMSDAGVSLEHLIAAANEFMQVASDFQDRLDAINLTDVMEVRRYNDQLLQLERNFLESKGLPGQPLYRHVIFAPSFKNAYAGVTFPGLADLLADTDKPDNATAWEKVKRHLSVIIYTIKCASASLEPYTDI